MNRMKNYGGALLLAGAIALAGCSGSDGAQGPKGVDGTNGTNGTNGVSGVPGTKLSLVIDAVNTTTTASTMTFTVRPAANVCPGGTCAEGTAFTGLLGKTTFYAQEYNATSNTFDTARNFSFSAASIKFKAVTADGAGAQFTITKTNPPFVPETSASAFVYAYITGKAAVTPEGNYYLPNSVASAAKVFGTIAYTSKANVAGCERCHGKPYAKHGYRMATIAGVTALPDFAACKVCHTDQRPGSDAQWYLIADDPASLVADPNLANTDLRNKYAYTANIMNDVHNSHAFEFNYPQSMANCVTCHAGKIDQIITDANFKPTTCKSCHPVTAVAGIEGIRAPSMASLWAASGYPHSGINLYTTTAADACNGCHKSGGSAPTFATLHAGYSKAIYSDANGTKRADTIKAQVDGASFDYASFVGTVRFSMVGLPNNAVVAPTVVAGLYGYDTKDFVLSGHSTSPKLECTGVDAACPAPFKTTASGTNTFTTTINLTQWQSMLQAGVVKRIEVGVFPQIAVDPTGVVSATNPMAVVKGATATLDVRASSLDPINAASTSYAATGGKAIVDVTKCNKCHDALGTTFHNPAYGAGTWIACRLCHYVGSGGSHLEMQSRSIDSYVHAIHQMQEFDVKNWTYGTFDPGVDPASAVSAMRYNDHLGAVYPNFAGPLNCESCHNPGTYDVPDQKKSMLGILSASGNFMYSPVRPIPVEASVVVGPAARACGACHRAQAINADDGSKLGAFYGHMQDESSFVSVTPDALYAETTASAYVQYLVGGIRTNPGVVTGAKAERCEICHATAGSQHQQLFDTWRNGTK